jgi:protein CLEC16A
MLGLFSSQEQQRWNGTASTAVVEDLQRRLRQLMASPEGTKPKQEDVVQVILQITEALISGERHGPRHGENNSFKVAHERGLLAELVQLLGSSRATKAVQVQLLQTFNMLVQNVRMDKSMEYLFGDNCVNRIITTPLDWQNEEILAYYICLLKSLAMRLDSKSLKYFFDAQTLGFPLYAEAVRFFCHRDQMVRAAVRTLTLQIYSVEDDGLRNFVLEHSASTYFVHLACHLCELWARFDDAVHQQTPRSHKCIQRLRSLVNVPPQEVNEQQQDLLIYLSDVMELGVQAITESLAEQLLRYCLLPVLVGSLRSQPEAPSPANVAEQLLRDFESVEAPMSRESEQSMSITSSRDVDHEALPRQLSPTVALFLLHQVFSLIRDRAVLEPLAAALLLPRVPAALESCWSHTPLPFPTTFRATTAEICGPSSCDFAHDYTFSGRRGPRCRSARLRRKHGDSSKMSSSVGEESMMSSPARIQGEVNAGGEEASIRHFFLQGFSSRCNAQVLLTAGILHLCITRHNTVLKGVLERALVLPRSCKPAPTSASASVGARIVERLQRPPSVEVASELKDTFERLDDFLDTAIDTAAGRRGSRNVLSEVQNLQAVPDMEKISHRSSSTMPSTATPDSESAIDDSADSLPGILGISQDTNTFWDEDDGVPAGHPLEVLVCAIKGLEQHLHISIVAVRVLARLVLDLAWNSVERPDLLTMPIWMAGRVEQTTFEKVSDLFHDVPGRRHKLRCFQQLGNVILASQSQNFVAVFIAC